jgi:four helix bundle protein
MKRFPNNALAVKSYQLALLCIGLVKKIQLEEKEYVLTRQILRSGTAPGALVREALQGESSADFVHKLSIALKEAHETEYWLSLLVDSNYISNETEGPLASLLSEVIALLTSIIKVTKDKNLNS